MSPRNFAIFRIDGDGFAHFLDNTFRTRAATKEHVRKNRRALLNRLLPTDARALYVANVPWFKANQDPDSMSEDALRKRLNLPARGGEKVVAFTGTIESVERKDARKIAESLGFRVTGSVSRKTSILVAAAGASPSKDDRAREFGIPVVTWSEFLEQNAK